MKQEANQHKVFLTGFILIILVIAWFLAKPFIASFRGDKSKQEEQKISEEILKAPSVSSEDLYKKLKEKNKIYVLDIRNSSDFDRGHIETSFNAGADKIKAELLSSLGIQKTSDVVIIGRGEDLPEVVSLTNKIVNFGFVNCKYLRGGVSDWQSQGYPLVSSGRSESNNQKVKKISIEEIEKETGSNPDLLQFIDLRDKDIFSREHIVRAVNIPLAELESRKAEIPFLKKVIVYGASEEESFQAAATLFDLNFFNVWQMDGGIEEWKAAGGNVE